MTLVELIVSILIVGVAMGGILSAFGVALRHNADPLVRKQALAIAESLMEEVSSRAYTDLDLHNPEAVIPNVIGPEGGTGETRISATTGFDNVDDYDGYSQTNVVTDAAGNALPLVGNYSTCVTVQNPPAAIAGVPPDQMLLIGIHVFGPGSQVFGGDCSVSAMAAASPLVRLNGYRMKYDPTP
jgi:MSHA pilin protein MshD